METDKVERIEAPQVKEDLIEKRQNLANWLETAPVEEKEIVLGSAGEEAVKDHIHVIDDTLEKTASGEFGICKICGLTVDDELLEMDYTAEVCLGHYSDEEVSHLERDLEMSRIVQRAMLPQDIPNIPGLDLAAFLRPAQIVGGDFFDFLRFRDGKYGILIGDVVGKGVSAGLIMASIQTALRTLTPEFFSPAEVLYRVNRLYAHNPHFTTFVTLFLGAYDPSSRTLAYCNAGQNPPVLLRSQNGSAQELLFLKPTAPAMGLVEDPPFRDEVVNLIPGDALLFYTDGIPEAFNAQSEQFDMNRLEASVRRNAGSGPKAMIRELQRDLLEFTGNYPLTDDITLVAARVEDA
jgi:phosphoserine phosphatase RsbU/P